MTLAFQPIINIAEPLPTASTSFSLNFLEALNYAKKNNSDIAIARADMRINTGLLVSTRSVMLPQINFFYHVDLDTGILDKNLASNSNHSSSMKLLFNQPIFSWGKLSASVAASKLILNEAKYAYSLVELDVLHDIALSYINILIIKTDLENIDIRLKVARTFLDNIKSKVDTQIATRLDLLRAESEYFGILPEKLLVENRYNNAVEIFCNKLGLIPTTRLYLDNIELADFILPVYYQERGEITQCKEKERRYILNERIIKANMRPHINLETMYGYDINHYSRLSKRVSDVWKTGINISCTLFDSFKTKGQLIENRAKLEQLIIKRIDQEQKFLLDNIRTRRELENAILLYQAAKKAHDVSLEELYVSREYFEQGLITSLDLLQSEHIERLKDSQRRYNELNVWRMLFNYRRSYGLFPV